MKRIHDSLHRVFQRHWSSVERPGETLASIAGLAAKEEE